MYKPLYTLLSENDASYRSPLARETAQDELAEHRVSYGKLAKASVVVL